MKNIVRNTSIMVMLIMMSLAFIQCKDVSANNFIKNQVEHHNKQYPKKLGSGLVIEKCEASGEKTLKFYYSVPDHLVGEMEYDDAAKKRVLNELEKLPEFTTIKEYGISYHYVYNDADKNLLGEIKITPEDYK